MGQRAFTNPSKVESESERARNRRRRQQQRHQSMVRQEYSAYPGIRVINSVHGQVPPEDASRNDSTSITAVDIRDVTELTTGRNFDHQRATVRQNSVRTGTLTGRT
ncbi:hypothetical protein IWW34DRAFT_810618 [Fusarium oxysporum f. sp. albedinis]|nr:hypothetical protein IWW34DRAFT_810618 [Fusarium oxysporum f. sp. albedinis]